MLEQFASRSATAAEDALDAEAAFSTLVARHGPMVLGVCRRALADPNEVEDAFQATFLVLVRRARSVRVGDSLGRWLYGVSRRVAAKARARSERARIRSTPLEFEPPAPATPADQTGLLAALDDEVTRLPAKYRAPVILCHLEGLSHAEAAARLHWPVGTVSGRLSRARGLLKERLVRRGMAPTAGAVGALLAAEGARAAVPEQLVAATARAAVYASMRGAAPVGAASASALTLMAEVLRAGLVVKLKAAVGVLLALAVACTAAVHFVGGSGTRTQSDDPGLEGRPAVSPSPAPARSADEIVKEIESLLKTARRPEAQTQFITTRTQIAARVAELRSAYPDDPRLTLYLPERWDSLTFLDQRAAIYAEIGGVIRSAKDPEFRKEALLFETCLKNHEPIDGRTSASLAESFGRQAPGDSRTGELLRLAVGKLDDDWYLRAGFFVIFGVFGAIVMLTTWSRSAGTAKLAVGTGALVLALLAAALIAFTFLSVDRQNAEYGFIAGWLNMLNGPTVRRRAAVIALTVLNKYPSQLQDIAWSGRAALALALALATALVLVVVHRRYSGTPRRWTSMVRQATLGFLAVLGVSCAVDAFLIGRQRDALEDRIVRDYSNLLKNPLVEGQRAQRERIGEPLELSFNDAITGRAVSTTALRGKVVVVDFWASYGDPFETEIGKLKKLYAEYHDKGVEFIGVSLDAPARVGGLDALKAFVARHQVPWPQFHDDLDSDRPGGRPGPTDRILASAVYYQGLDRDRVLRGTAAGHFADSWGITSLPSAFLIDTEGKLYSTDAQYELETLIPRLLNH